MLDDLAGQHDVGRREPQRRHCGRVGAVRAAGVVSGRRGLCHCGRVDVDPHQLGGGAGKLPM